MEHEVIVFLSMKDFAMILSRKIMIQDSKYINEKEQHENPKRLCVLSPWRFFRTDYFFKTFLSNVPCLFLGEQKEF